MPRTLQTLLTTDLQAAAACIRSGELVAFPTETVYGLGADVFNEDAIRKVFAAKGRPSDNPLIVHVASTAEITRLVADIPALAEVLIEAFFPGPLTLVMAKRPEVPMIASGGLDTIGVRMPEHALAREFISACGVPLVAPSANLSGHPSPTTWEAVAADMTGRIACILKGPPTDIGLESTVVDCTGETPVILRSGGITLEALQQVIPATRVSGDADTQRPKSPGLKYRHYAPKARVFIVDADAKPPVGATAAWIGLDRPRSNGWREVRQCVDVADYARELFSFFRACDELGLRIICCERVPERGLGVALMDRISRAAER